MDLSIMKSVDTKELPMLLERAAFFGGRLIQPHLEPLQTEIAHIEVRPDGRLLVKMLDSIPLEETRGVLINLNYRDLFFRLNPGQFFIQQDTIYATMPDCARALPQRNSERYVLSSELIHTSLQRIEVRERERNLSARIIDVSHSGLALYFGPLEDGTLVFNDHVWIKKVHHIDLSEPLFGKIAYYTPERTGIALDQSMPEELLEHLKKLSRSTLAA